MKIINPKFKKEQEFDKEDFEMLSYERYEDLKAEADYEDNYSYLEEDHDSESEGEDE